MFQDLRSRVSRLMCWALRLIMARVSPPALDSVRVNCLLKEGARRSGRGPGGSTAGGAGAVSASCRYTVLGVGSRFRAYEVG